MATEAVADPLPSSLSGVARVLVNAGKLSTKAAEELLKSARDRIDQHPSNSGQRGGQGVSDCFSGHGVQGGFRTSDRSSPIRRGV